MTGKVFPSIFSLVVVLSSLCKWGKTRISNAGILKIESDGDFEMVRVRLG